MKRLFFICVLIILLSSVTTKSERVSAPSLTPENELVKSTSELSKLLEELNQKLK